MSERGIFITFEGIEGCGKTTQQRLLTPVLEEAGISFVATKQPGGSRIGTAIRQILLHKDSQGMAPACEALLYLADRAQHHAEVIEPTLRAGSWVICDRYQDSTLAYQGAARGMAAAELNHIFALVTGNLQPDLTVLLDLDPRIGLARAKSRLAEMGTSDQEGRFEDEALTFHQAVRQSFLEMAESQSRYLVLDANRGADAIAADLLEAIRERGYLVR